MKYYLPCFFLLFICTFGIAQRPVKPSSSEIYESVEKLNFLGSVLYVAAHPDDENTRLISYFSNHLNARTAYLSLTRGDGGQNLIGPEIREFLGVIRTQELLAARGVDGAEQFFTRANDFGYSKHPDETLAIWNKDAVLNDVVSRIRNFKPDIIINRFDHRTAGTTHGHHTSSALLSMEAFDLANDSNYKTHKGSTDLWQPKRLFFNTSWWFYGSEDKFEKADRSKLLNFDIGLYYPLNGLSNNEIASLASSQHLSQGFGRLTTRGTEQEYIEFLKGDFPKDKANVFDGIDTSWNRVEGGAAIGIILEEVAKNFNFKDPTVHIPQLLAAYQLIEQLKDTHWKEIKSAEIKNVIASCMGLFLEVSATDNYAIPNGKETLNIEAINRSGLKVELEGIHFEAINSSLFSGSQPLENNEKFTLKKDITIPSNTKYTTPYWLLEKGSLGMYHVADETLIGLPENKHLKLRFNLVINGVLIDFERPIVRRYSKPDKGELYQPFEIVPEVTASVVDKIIIFADDSPKEVAVKVKATNENLSGKVALNYPKDWNVSPVAVDFKIAQKGGEQTIYFTVSPPKNQSEGKIAPIVTIGNAIYTKELVAINYDHIPKQAVVLPSESKVVRLNIQKKGQKIAYIQGAGDNIPESLRQIGYTVVELKSDEVSGTNLQSFDAIIVGIRAYNIDERAKYYQKQLHAYVENGGTLLVQYNTNRGLKVDQVAPLDLQLSRDRVTDEHSSVTILNSGHEALNFPNKIAKTDFDGWVQERGLYFPDKWDGAFTPLLSMHDKGESPKNGSVLVAKYGKGNFIYTGLSFFRELPAGVPGAFKLYANLLSLGKNSTEKPIKN
tara:strand:- start:93385 stop:95901 length:2517 start_codon:yes stop_codon:yes gene_type:complete